MSNMNSLFSTLSPDIVFKLLKQQTTVTPQRKTSESDNYKTNIMPSIKILVDVLANVKKNISSDLKQVHECTDSNPLSESRHLLQKFLATQSHGGSFHEEEKTFDSNDSIFLPNRIPVNLDSKTSLFNVLFQQPLEDSMTIFNEEREYENQDSYPINKISKTSSTISNNHNQKLSLISKQNQLSERMKVCSSNPRSVLTTQRNTSSIDGVNLDEIREFARHFKMKRISLGLTQTQVGQALSATEGPAYSQSAICRFEKLDITPKSAQRIKPVLEKWLMEAEERYRQGSGHNGDSISSDSSRKRKRRTSFNPQALEILNDHFDRNPHPTGSEMSNISNELNYDREVIRVWFCNKRQALKNTVRRIQDNVSSNTSSIQRDLPGTMSENEFIPKCLMDRYEDIETGNLNSQ